MNDIIEQLIEYNQGQSNLPAILGIRDLVGTESLNLGSIALLGWLRDRATGHEKAPLKLDGPLGKHVRALVIKVPELSDLFTINNESLEFGTDVSLVVRQQIEDFVLEHPFSADGFFYE